MDHSAQSRKRRYPRRPLLLIALACCCITIAVAVSSGQRAKASSQPSLRTLVSATGIPSISPIGTLPIDTTTPSPTSTPPPASTTSPTAAPTAAATATQASNSTPTATTDTSTGGNYTGGDGSSTAGGPQPTKVVLAQPTFQAGTDINGGPSDALSGANGLVLATVVGCVTGVLGIIIAAISLMVLVRGGYGPFLKQLLRGKRGAKRGKNGGGKRGASGGEFEPLALGGESGEVSTYGRAYDDRLEDDDLPSGYGNAWERSATPPRAREANRVAPRNGGNRGRQYRR